MPALWQACGSSVPPAVCINGGCAMNLPTPVQWPDSAVTFILLGGQDYFRGKASADEYLAATKSRVPSLNSTTAILYVEEMQHMPQQRLLSSILRHMLRALLEWKACSVAPPLIHFGRILEVLHKDGWRGRLAYVSSPGAWEDICFSPVDVGRLPAPQAPLQQCLAARPESIELSRQDELKALWKAAVAAAMPQGGAPVRCGGSDRFAAVVQAAAADAATRAKAAEPRQYAALQHPQQPPGHPKLLLPISTAGRGDPQDLRISTAAGEAHGGGAVAEPTPIARALGMPPRCSPHPSPWNSRCGHSHYPAQFFLTDPAAA